MAVFNPWDQPTNDPSYLGLAKTTDKIPVKSMTEYPSNPTPPSPRTFESGSGQLLADLGTTLRLGVNAADNLIKKNISDQVNEGVDNLRTEFGVDAVSDAITPNTGDLFAEAGGDPTKRRGKGLPPGVQNQVEKLGTVKDAYEAGALSETAYWARAYTIAKQIRAQNPGYRDEVDQLISRRLGTDPANAVRRSMQNDLDRAAAANQAKASQDETFVRNHAGKYLSPTDQVKWLSGELDHKNAIRMIMYGQRGEQELHTIIAENNALTSVDKRAADNAMKEGTFRLSTALETVLGNIPSPISTGSFRDTLTQISSGQLKPTPEQTDAIAKKFQESLSQIDRYVDQYAYEVRVDRDGKPYTLAQRLGKDKLKELREMARERLNQAQTLIGEAKLGLYEYDRLYNSTKQDERERKLATTFPALKDIGVYRKWLGDPILQMTLFNENLKDADGKPLLTPILKQLSSGLMLSLMDGKEISPDKAVEKIVKNGGTREEAGAVLKITNDNAIRVLLQPKTGDKDNDKIVALNAARYLFNPESGNFLQQINNPNTRQAVYEQFTSPNIYNRIKELGDPTLLQNYIQWTERQFAGQFKQAISTVSSAANKDFRFKIDFDPNTSTFSYTPNPEVNPTYANMLRGSKSEGDPIIRSTIDTLNRTLRTISPILKDQREDVNQYLADLLINGMGMDLRYATAGREAFYDKLKEGLTKSLDNASSAIRRGFDSLEVHPKETLEKAGRRYLGTERP